MRRYRPPPAHAHAQPAHAQAQAQAQPPLLPPLLRPLLDVDGLGGGLVTCVTPPVKSVTLRTMRLDVPSTPRTIDAAKVAPGSVGRLTRPLGRDVPVEGAWAGRVPAVVVRAHGR